MKEDFLHYLWQYQVFDKSELFSTDNKSINVFKTGFKNFDAGPDFLQAKILIDNIEWVGQVEIHLRSSDWNLHAHQNDDAYQNVILHVVWEHDRLVFRKDGSELPCLELKNRVDQNTLQKYNNLQNNESQIACKDFLEGVSDITKLNLLDKALMHRLERKNKEIVDLLTKSKNDWEEICYKVFAKNMGFKLNSEAFLRLTEVLPLKIIQKHQHNLFQLEALCFGQAGFLSTDLADEYFLKLQKEHIFLAKKYEIYDLKMPKSEWKFLRTRPGNFPSIRIAQFASIISQIKSFFDFFIQNNSIEFILKQLSVSSSDYWLNHSDFGKDSNEQMQKSMGKTSIETLIINSHVNLKAAYGHAVDNQEYVSDAIAILENIKAESNKITKMWAQLGLKVQSAFDSQALIEQYNEFCNNKRCVHCVVGTQILKENTVI